MFHKAIDPNRTSIKLGKISLPVGLSGAFLSGALRELHRTYPTQSSASISGKHKSHRRRMRLDFVLFFLYMETPGDAYVLVVRYRLPSIPSYLSFYETYDTSADL